MYARVTTFAIVPEKVDKALDIAETSVFPALQQQRGFKGMLKLFDRQTGKAISVTLWETEADLKAGESDGFAQQQVAKFASLVSALPTQETFEATLDRCKIALDFQRFFLASRLQKRWKSRAIFESHPPIW